MDEKLDDLQKKGQEIGLKVRTATAGLDFHQDLTAILDDCISLAVEAVSEEPTCAGLEHVLAGIGAEIFRTYTMKSERDVHLGIFGAGLEGIDAEPAPQGQPLSDEDLFDEALF